MEDIKNKTSYTFWDFIKPTKGKIILFVLLIVASLFLVIVGSGCGFVGFKGFFCGGIIMPLLFIIGIGYYIGIEIINNNTAAIIFQVIFSYVLTIVIIGVYGSIKGRTEWKKTLSYIILIILLIGLFSIPFSIKHNSDVNERVRALGWVPEITSKQECEKLGFYWSEKKVIIGGAQCKNNLTEEECLSKGYEWVNSLSGPCIVKLK